MREPVFKRSHSGEDLYAVAYMQHQREPGLRHVRSEPHISPIDVETVLSGLAENTVIVLPRTCCEAAGLAPNINDKQQPKHLWVGRLKHLNRMLSATSLQQAVQPQEVRRSFLQAALDEVECRRPSDAEIPMQLAQLPGWKLQQMAHAAIVIQKMWRGRRARQANSLDVLKAFSACITKGTVVYLCGSTGLAGDSLRYVRMLAGLGYLVIAPDALAGTSPLRHRRPRLILRPDQATDYWERNLLYEDDGAEGELVYVSTSEGVLASPDHFDQVFNNIITVRQAELAFTLRRLPAFIKRQGVFLFGMSEGAVTLSTFNDEYFASMVRGRVLASYSCECNYWNYNRPEDVGIAGSADIPTLNLMGFEDEYFGVHNSVAATVAAYGGYPPIAGHAFQPMMERGIQWGLACHFEGGHHSLLLSHDDVIREILSDFLVRPLTTCRSLAVLWGNLPDLQDEITRVRRSADEKVLYVRIRPSPGPVSPPLAAKQSSRLEALLDALSARLYEVENSDGTAHPGAPNWSELHLTPPHSPQTSGGASGLPAGLRPGAASPLGGHSPIASSPEGATPTFAAGLDKSKARAATARLLAHFALRNATQPDSLVPQSSLPAGSSPLGSARGSLSAASAPPGPSTATTPSSSSSGLADTPTAASTPAGVVMLTAGVAAMREGPGQEQQQFSGQHYSAATVAQSAGLAGEGRCAAGLEAQDGSAPAATPTSPGSQRGSSQLLTGTEGGSGVRLGIPQQQVVVGNCGGERASSPPTQPGGSLVVSALSAALRGSSTGGLGCAPALPNGMAEQEASSNEMAVAVISGADAASHPTVEGGRQPAAMVAADTAGDGLPTASLGLSASPSHVHTRPHPDVLANGRHGPPLDAAAGAAAELHFSPVQKLLAASLATEQQLSPSSSPPRSGRSGASWQQPRPLNSAGRGPGHYYARSYSGRSLAAAAAASAAALGVASAEQQQEEFEAGLETLQDWMISQGAQPSSPGKPRSPQRGSRPPSARSTDSMRRPPRSVHFSEQEEPRPPRSCDAGWGSFAGGSEGVTDEGSGSDLGTEEEESTIERSPSLAVDLQKLCRAMAFQTEAVTKATEALASTAQAASWVAAGSLAVLVLLSIVIVARP